MKLDCLQNYGTSCQIFAMIISFNISLNNTWRRVYRHSMFTSMWAEYIAWPHFTRRNRPRGMCKHLPRGVKTRAYFAIGLCEHQLSLIIVNLVTLPDKITYYTRIDHITSQTWYDTAVILRNIEVKCRTYLWTSVKW